VRKTFVAGGTGLAGVAFALCPLGGPIFSAAMLTLATIGLSMSASNLWAITQRLAGPQAAGRWTGFQCSFGNLAGIIIPTLTGFILDYTGHFEWTFAILALICLAGAAIWIFLVGPVEQVSWGKHRMAKQAALSTVS